MSWFCDTPEAIAQMELCDKNKCEGCRKCIWIEESGWAKSEYAKPKPAEPHPLMKQIIDKFDGRIIDE